MVVAIALCASPAFAQSADPVSGRWGAGGSTFLDLTLEADAVSGTVFWRAAGEAVRSDVRKGTFDARTWERGSQTIAARRRGPPRVPGPLAPARNAVR